ncbi:hypothetical protein PTKIN_Ptkin02bG0111700 [Pterospermum kingtungense]
MKFLLKGLSLKWLLTEGKATQITRICSIGGGCINLVNCYDTDVGSFFLKTNCCAEAIGLGAMYETGTLRVPKPFKETVDHFIIMDLIEFGASQSNQSVPGRKLAEMYKVVKLEKSLGFAVDNTIGSLLKLFDMFALDVVVSFKGGKRSMNEMLAIKEMKLFSGEIGHLVKRDKAKVRESCGNQNWIQRSVTYKEASALGPRSKRGQAANGPGTFAGHCVDLGLRFVRLEEGDFGRVGLRLMVLVFGC